MNIKLLRFDIAWWFRRQKRRFKNHTLIFAEGYSRGYDQALVDKGFKTQKEADKQYTKQFEERLKLGMKPECLTLEACKRCESIKMCDKGRELLREQKDLGVLVK